MTEADRTARDGVIAALVAYLTWGVLPAFLLLIVIVPAPELLAHRIIWSVPGGALIIGLRAQWPEVRRAFTTPRTFGWLCVSALFIGINWLVYIYAVQVAQIFQASLGYYINPLLLVLVGVMFFGEKLTSLQLAAVVAATIGVTVLTISGGELPWISLVLAVSFTIYGVLRKQVEVGGMPGLFVETVLLLPFALAWVAYIHIQGTNLWLETETSVSLLLMLAGPLTVIPLLGFALAARRLRLSTIGFMQFIAPTMQFGIGVLSGEPLSQGRLVCMVLIWLAVILFCADGLIARRKRRRATSPEAPRAG